jgi:hypothetical protein
MTLTSPGWKLWIICFAYSFCLSWINLVVLLSRIKGFHKVTIYTDVSNLVNFVGLTQPSDSNQCGIPVPVLLIFTCMNSEPLMGTRMGSLYTHLPGLTPTVSGIIGKVFLLRSSVGIVEMEVQICMQNQLQPISLATWKTQCNFLANRCINETHMLMKNVVEFCDFEVNNAKSDILSIYTVISSILLGLSHDSSVAIVARLRAVRSEF